MSIYLPSQTIPEIVLNITSETIAAKTRKLKAVWTMEAQRDIMAQHNPSAEDELAEIMAQEIADEIDREVLADLRIASQNVVTEEFRFKNRKKKIIPRPITDSWEVSRFD